MFLIRSRSLSLAIGFEEGSYLNDSIFAIFINLLYYLPPTIFLG